MAFQTLKDKLCNAPNLALPDGLEDFAIYCNVSCQGLGYVLLRRGKVIAYASRLLKIHKKNYTTHDLELGAVLFNNYDCEIRHHPGKANVVADALSRNEIIKPRRVQTMNMTIQSSIHDEQIDHRNDGALYYMDRIWVPLTGGVRTLIMDEAYKSRTGSRHDSIWVIVDILTKSAHFLPIREDFKMDRLARLYLNEIMARHGVLISIISDRDNRITSRFWKSMQGALETRLDMSMAYHPQTDGQSDHTIHTLEDMLRACVINFGGTLYERKCRSPILWAEMREGKLIGPEIVQETTEKISQIKDRLKAARDRQKSYVEKCRKPLEFNVGDHVLLKVTPWKGVVRFGKKGKLAPMFVGPFEITERIGPVAYRLRLPQELTSVHDTFHVSNLKKCLADPTLHVPLEKIQVDAKLNFVEEPVEILERKIKKLKQSRIHIVEVRWNSKRGP
ncbi:putative reverse transcriptase domain-containing protein [Tanacetum coccineum]|uniref:Reverse transcriptase domain-containing protein n=1 Tax=Tanacetum coccineum TaxID=301880 RepID=A0ABQ4XGU5_9ASTR